MQAESHAFDDYLLSRQPVLDAEQQLIGYELSLQSATETEDASRIATLVCAAYAELGIGDALGHATAFLTVDAGFLHDDAIEALPSSSVILGIQLDAAPDGRTLERCRALRDRQYVLSIPDYAGLDERSAPLLPIVEIVRINVEGLDDRAITSIAAPLARLPIKLLARGVDCQETFDRCRGLGFQLFQGVFFARPEIVSGRRLSASQASLIRLINMTGSDADTTRIEDEIKREPALTINLLRIVNSVGNGLARRITSLRHAITILGRRQLQRWLQLLLLTPAGKTPDARRTPLLQVAALRGRMMELLAESCFPRDRKLADQAFMTGVMSMMPVALGLPITEILQQIALEPEVSKALTVHEGPLGKALALLECFDAEDTTGCEALFPQFPAPRPDRARMNRHLIDALRWINGNEI